MLPAHVCLCRLCAGSPDPPAKEVPDCPLTRFVGLFVEALERDNESLAVAVRFERSPLPQRQCLSPAAMSRARNATPLAQLRPQVRAKYAPALAADPALEPLLDGVEAVFFDRGGGRGGPGGILGELLSAFMDD